MRLYNAQSCTPVGSTSMFVAPKSKKLESKSILPSAEITERRRLPPAGTATSIHHNATMFNPFRGIGDSSLDDRFDHKIATQSTETTATDDLTPEFAAISKEFSSGSEAYDDFPIVATPGYGPDRWPAIDSNFVDNCDAASTSHNTWTSDLTSSTLSTKFTSTLFSNNRVEVTVEPETQDEIQRAFSLSPIIFPLESEGPTDDKVQMEKATFHGTDAAAFQNAWPAESELPGLKKSSFQRAAPIKSKQVHFASFPKDSFELEDEASTNGDDFVAVRNKLQTVVGRGGRRSEQHTEPRLTGSASTFNAGCDPFRLDVDDDAFSSNRMPSEKRNEVFEAQRKTPHSVRLWRKESLSVRQRTEPTRGPMATLSAPDAKKRQEFGRTARGSATRQRSPKTFAPLATKNKQLDQMRDSTPASHQAVDFANESSSFFATLPSELAGKALVPVGKQPSSNGRLKLSENCMAQLQKTEQHPRESDSAHKPESHITGEAIWSTLESKDDCGEKVPKADTPGSSIRGLEKYRKMLDLGLPMGAVKNAMQRDGLDPNLLESSTADTAPDLAKYHKMLTLGLPMGAVRNAMVRDGVDPGLLGGEGGATGSSAAAALVDHRVKRPKDAYRRTRIHWETHNVVRSNTVWAMVGRDPDVSGMRVDEEEFVRLFRAEANVTRKKAEPSRVADHGGVKLIDPKRANNGGIILARIKLSYEDIALSVDSLDETALTQEQIAGLSQYLPSAEERKALVAYLNRDSNVDVESLCECEKFMVAMLGVRKAKRKLNALLFMQRFQSGVEEIRHDARVVHKACDEIMGATGLRKILGIALALGNRLNTAGSTGKTEATAITLESLLKLKQVKAFDKETTILQWMVTVIRRSNASLVHFKDELASVFAAKLIQWDQTVAELRKVETQLESVRRLALHYSRALCVATGARFEYSEVDSATLRSNLSTALEDEATLLRTTPIGMFTLDARVRMATVTEEVEVAKTAFNACLLYFGEGDRQLSPSDVFETLSVFCDDFETTNSFLVKQEKAQVRRAKRECPHHSNSGKEDSKPRQVAVDGILEELRGKTSRKGTPWRRRRHL